MSSKERYQQANDAGQQAEISTVESVTGVHINNYVVMNLAGFFYLAQDFGGVEVCVTPTTVNGTPDANLSDQASGWNAVADGYNLKKGGSQYLHLAADQALAFVRDRDSLPDTDLSRTHRQQAVIDYVIWQLKHENAFIDIGQLTALLGDANQYVITNNGFNLFDFATNMSALTGSNLKFDTLPIAGYSDIELNGSMQDVNDIDLSYIQKVVNTAFNPPAPVAKSGESRREEEGRARPAGVDGDGRRLQRRVHPGLAGAVSQALVALGYKQGAIGDAPAGQTVTAGTQVFYGAGASANAAKIAAKIGATASAARVAARRPRGGAARHRLDRGAGGLVLVDLGQQRHHDAGRPVLGRGQQRGRRERGHRRREREVRHTLRVLNSLDRTRGEASDVQCAYRADSRGQGRIHGDLSARGRLARGVRLRPQDGQPG